MTDGVEKSINDEITLNIEVDNKNCKVDIDHILVTLTQ